MGTNQSCEGGGFKKFKFDVRNDATQNCFNCNVTGWIRTFRNFLGPSKNLKFQTLQNFYNSKFKTYPFEQEIFDIGRSDTILYNSENQFMGDGCPTTSILGINKMNINQEIRKQSKTLGEEGSCTR